MIAGGVAIKNALRIKSQNPDSNVYVFYRDIRTYGTREDYYRKAREAGVIFIRYSLDSKPEVNLKKGRLLVKATDPIIGRPVEIETDLLTLATAVVPNRDDQLANFFKVSLNDDGFFVERHAKLGPSEFATDGVFLCGLAHYPKPIDESVAQAQADLSSVLDDGQRTILQKQAVEHYRRAIQIDPGNRTARYTFVFAILPD